MTQKFLRHSTSPETGTAFDSYTERKIAIEKIIDATSEALDAKFGEGNVDSNDVARAFDELQEKLYRKNILDTGKRVDGRGVKDLRTITAG